VKCDVHRKTRRLPLQSYDETADFAFDSALQQRLAEKDLQRWADCNPESKVGSVKYSHLDGDVNPLLQPPIYNHMSFIELFFRLIPPAFFINVCLYYLIMENILLAMAELTQLSNRVFYQDWWNAQTVS
jgi:hypothetical protein